MVTEQDRPISKPEDYVIRLWIKNEYGIKIPQWGFWNMTPGEAVDFLKEKDRTKFKSITAEDIIKAARRV